MTPHSRDGLRATPTGQAHGGARQGLVPVSGEGSALGQLDKRWSPVQVPQKVR